MVYELGSVLALVLLSVVIQTGLVCAVMLGVKNRAASVAFCCVLLALLVYNPEYVYCKPWPAATTPPTPSWEIAAGVFIIMVFLGLWAATVFLVFDSNFLAVILFVWLPLASLTLASNFILCYAPDFSC